LGKRKVGRPRLENPRNRRAYLRLTEEEFQAIRAYTKEHGLTITHTLVHAFNYMLEHEKTGDK